ncbi:glutamate--tRNA ligase [Wenyingzhuangia marina]|uniref:Glutamate--tRNA ligase n=1 Tax=Wenyingzhuangia marina TaxID=1195760 RepID=A0A1M5SU87_9FLAO|nr:glutamate--tRNA ligase [Wenyingzhuangia marina]GGF64000.1 glutamate--tRNA ligase [Wenyingzhuangia marina]SHH42037.1 glutamyl-tRNA synthetase [Wenyingzhuangia marina]
MENVRVRFAPSPTGPLHIGGVRTALFNYLFAKKNNGTFVLRIEDTDQTRYVANAEKYIIDALEWCGIPFEEGPGKNEKFGPYRQSERKDIYKKYADALVASKQAYYAFDTAEELDALRTKAEAEKTVFVYNNVSRETLNNSINLSEEEVTAKLAAGEKYVIRFKTPKDQKLILDDMIRGEITIDTNTLDDKILFKSDGMPTYHLANIVDDHLMQISHVIRGEEWLPSLPLHSLLYEAFGWIAPKFAHLPLILKPVGKGKLSKRDGDKLGFPVFPLNYTNEETGEISRGYREDGYFNDAFINMLSLLGWNPGTEQEIFSLEELANIFSIERVSKSGAKFSPEKTNWFNQQYMQQKSNEEIADLFIKLNQEKVKDFSKEYITKVIEQVKERAVFTKDLWDLSDYYFTNPTSYDEKASKKQWKPDTKDIMLEVKEIIKNIEDFKSIEIENKVKAYLTEKELGFGKVMPPLRLCIVGEMKGPHLFDIIEMISKENTLQRIENAIEKLG